MRIAAGDVRKAVFCLVLMIVFAVFAEAATQKVCTETEVKEAQKEAGQLRDWDSVYRSFKRFAHCDEGGIAEEYSDSVGRLLARDWKHLNAFVRLTTDQDFEQFVIRTSMRLCLKTRRPWLSIMRGCIVHWERSGCVSRSQITSRN